MSIKQFRGVDFVNRDKEIEFFMDYFQKKPERILWVYGPKSTGKTTLIEYIVENKLHDDFLKLSGKYNVKYINFRGKAVANYDNFVDALLEVKDEELDSMQTELNRAYNILNVFKLEAKTLKNYHEKNKDIFDILAEEFRKSKRQNIFIIDEIQALEDIYINGSKLLLNEFLNFCIRLTKELHLSHVVILTSNTLFLNTIYNNAKMKVTSQFKLINHLDYNEIKSWLSPQPSALSPQLIYDYFGGSVAHIKKLLDNYKYFNSLQDYLDSEVNLAKNEIEVFIAQRKLSKDLVKKFYFIAKEILKNGYFKTSNLADYLEVISLFVEVEILFYDPIQNLTTANSRIYEKAFEKKLKAKS